jgi:hypothetical protein
LSDLICPIKGKNEKNHSKHVPQYAHVGEIVGKQGQDAHAKEDQCHEHSPNLSETKLFHYLLKQVKEKRRYTLLSVLSPL